MGHPPALFQDSVTHQSPAKFTESQTVLLCPLAVCLRQKPRQSCPCRYLLPLTETKGAVSTVSSPTVVPAPRRATAAPFRGASCHSSGHLESEPGRRLLLKIIYW